MRKIAETPTTGKNTGSDRSKTCTCACSNPTHFLGSCRVTVSEPGTTCSNCMKDHFVPNEDPAISKA